MTESERLEPVGGPRLDQRTIDLMMSLIRPGSPAQANLKRAGVAKLIRLGMAEHMMALPGADSPPEVYRRDAEIMARDAEQADAFYLTSDFTSLWNLMVDGYDPDLNFPMPGFYANAPILFMERGAELFFPGDGGGNVVAILPFYAKKESEDLTFWSAVFTDDGAVITTHLESGETARRILSVLWLIQQTELATIEVQDHTRNLSRAERRAGKKRVVNRVHVVDLRHSVKVGVQNAADAIEAEAEDRKNGKRNYQHRWVVRGHWRNQRVGVGRTRIQRTFVAPYVKGPDGAPLVDRVYRW